jgi:translation initiation factor IF-2
MAHDERIRVRVKWGNVARAAVALAALALVVAWPRLGGAPPALPDDRAVPFAAATAPATPATGDPKAGADAAADHERRAGRTPAAQTSGRGAARHSRRAAGRRPQKREPIAAGAKRRLRSGGSRRDRAGRPRADRARTPRRTHTTRPVPAAPPPAGSLPDAAVAPAAPPVVPASPPVTRTAPPDPEFGFEG